VVEITIERWQPRANAQGLILASQIEPDLPPIMLDRIRMNQVLTNLLSNALRHTSEGGRIDITVTLEDDEKNVLVSVSDTGEGIAQELLPHLFDRFYRVDAARSRETGGSGLGLSTPSR
jgi:two-component system sensor histidine kinase BaeS